MDLSFSLHPGQMEVFNDDTRFKVVVAGRRWGKSRLACVQLLLEALKNEDEHGNSLKGKEVYYIAPTFEQAKRIMWDLIKQLGHDVIAQSFENTAALRLINGRKIELKGADRPDTLRGVGLSYVVLDEYADMKPEVWEQIVSPALSDVKGGALFIGTPKGKNHFFELYNEAEEDEEWQTFTYKSVDNPTIDSAEWVSARKRSTAEGYRQEYEASFTASGSGIFKEELILYRESEPGDGYYFISVDPAGYADVDTGSIDSKLKRLDECAISVVKIHNGGWWVKEIISGRWGIRETALRIIKAAHNVRALAVGIESGALKNAIIPYLQDYMARLNVYPRIEGVTHGGKKKVDRIAWALQGRFEHGRIQLNKGEWNKKFIDQLLDFPNKMAHDDLIDSLAYIDQVGSYVYFDGEQEDEYRPIDIATGV